MGHGQALTQEHGSPGIASIFLFAAGAAAAWGMLRFLSVGESSSSGLQLAGSPHLVRAGAIHVAAIAGAIGAAMLAGAVVGGVAAWPVGSFTATLVYLATAAIELWLREREQERED